jgi:hypothetical protein
MLSFPAEHLVLFRTVSDPLTTSTWVYRLKTESVEKWWSRIKQLTVFQILFDMTINYRTFFETLKGFRGVFQELIFALVGSRL